MTTRPTLCPFDDSDNACYSAALYSLFCAAPGWCAGLHASVPTERLTWALAGSFGPANLLRAEMLMALDALVDAPSAQRAQELDLAITELLQAIGNTEFRAGEQADPSELLGVLIDQIAKLSGAEDPTHFAFDSLLISPEFGYRVNTSGAGPNTRSVFDQVSFASLLRATCQNAELWLTPGAPQLTPVFIGHGKAVITVTVDSGAVQAGQFGQAPNHYDVTVFLSNNRIYRLDHGRVFPITQAQLTGRAAVMSILVDEPRLPMQ